MPAPDVVTAVKARVAANWTHAPVFDLNEEEEAPGDGSAYLLILYPISDSEQMSIGDPGNNLHRESGVIRFLLYYGRGQGIETAMQWAWDLASLFRQKIFDGVRTLSPASPTIDDRNDVGNYYVFPVTVPYQYDFFG